MSGRPPPSTWCPGVTDLGFVPPSAPGSAPGHAERAPGARSPGDPLPGRGGRRREPPGEAAPGEGIARGRETVPGTTLNCPRAPERGPSVGSSDG